MDPRFVPPDSYSHKFVLVGSVLGLVKHAATVWGAGVITSGERLAPEVRLVAVRGPLTRQAALSSGVECPEVFGDPGMLLPRLFPIPGDRSGVALVPHLSDAARLRVGWKDQPDLRLVDPQYPVEDVVRQIASAELVVSSSLHGLVVAHAYGVPTVWVEFARLPAGDRTKFYDHLMAVGIEPRPPIRTAAEELDVEGLARWATRAPAFDAAPLLRACPFASTELEEVENRGG